MLHPCLNNNSKKRDTPIADAETLKQKVTELSATDYSVNKTEFQLQFVVTNLHKVYDFHYTVANSNKKKNQGWLQVTV